MKKLKQIIATLIVCLSVGVISAEAQPTEFTYQGRLLDSNLPPTGNYDFEVRLFATETGGVAIATNQRPGVAVANGIFSVKLDFAGNLDGQPRWLEIAVKPDGSPNPLTVLSPRQPITSAPYSIRSLTAERADSATNSLQLGGVNANQYVQTNDARLSDARNPLPNSASYVQNTTSQQSSSNFNISGSGTIGGNLTVGGSFSLNIVNAQTQYNLGGNRILSNAGTGNLFAGVGAGSSTTGINNSFFGRNAGNDHTTGNGNSFFGNGAGAINTTSSANSFFGNSSGSGNTTGASNSFFGNAAGNTNTTGSNNTVIGANADVSENNLTFATAIGAGAVANTSNRINLGRSNGLDEVAVFGNTVLGGHLVVINEIFAWVLGSSGTQDVCRNAALILSTCSSSLRYKTSVQPFIGGLDVVRRLRPITFNWKTGGMRDVGFAAEGVEKIEPLLVTYNSKGEIEGVKYKQITTVLVNAVKEQQTQIEKQQELNKKLHEQVNRQQLVIDGLRKLVCQHYPTAEVCKGVQK